MKHLSNFNGGIHIRFYMYNLNKYLDNGVIDPFIIFKIYENIHRRKVCTEGICRKLREDL
jgi:hypothetical protein